MDSFKWVHDWKGYVCVPSTRRSRSLCVLAGGWLTGVGPSSLTQPIGLIDRCLDRSLGTSGAQGDWQVSCRAEGPPLAVEEYECLCCSILQRTKHRVVVCSSTIVSLYLSIFQERFSGYEYEATSPGVYIPTWGCLSSKHLPLSTERSMIDSTVAPPL